MKCWRALALAIGLNASLAACGNGGYTSLGENTEPGGGKRPPTILSGLPWPSGANADDLASIDAWASYRGRPNDVALVLTDYTTWEGITRPDAVLQDFQAFPGTLVIALPLWQVQAGGSLGACAAGDYDAHWRELGTTLSAHGRERSIVRLGWQFNGDNVEWSATDPAAFVTCYRRIVSAIRTNAPEALIDWSMEAHGTEAPAGGDAFDVYPGDEFVDVIGIDAFDMTPPSPDEASFLAQCNGPQGICSVAAFARRHGKLLGSGQWCVVTCFAPGDDGGDNPFYVERMQRVFAENADIMAYETYYNDGRGGLFCTSLIDPLIAPRASARYKALWGR